MKRFITLAVISAVLLLCGCVFAPDAAAPTRSTSQTTAVTEPLTEQNTSPATTEIAATTEPGDLLGIAPGNYCEQIFAKNERDYLDYWVFVPENAKKDMPLIVFLHGIYEVKQMEKLENYGAISAARDIYGDVFPFIVLNPCSQVYSWTYGSNPELLFELIEQVVQTYSIDRDRIIITGHSMGSIGTWHMLSQYGDYFCAAVPVSCGYDGQLDYSNLAKVPVLGLAGDIGEQERLFANGMKQIADNIERHGGDASITILTGNDHDSMVSAAYTADVFQWMLSQ